jgi:hypothetical protein
MDPIGVRAIVQARSAGHPCQRRRSVIDRGCLFEELSVELPEVIEGISL